MPLRMINDIFHWYTSIQKWNNEVAIDANLTNALFYFNTKRNIMIETTVIKSMGVLLCVWVHLSPKFIPQSFLSHDEKYIYFFRWTISCVNNAFTILLLLCVTNRAINLTTTNSLFIFLNAELLYDSYNSTDILHEISMFAPLHAETCREGLPLNWK